MDLPELFNIIFNQLNIRDRRALLSTCKKYNKPQLLNNVKYALFSVISQGYPVYYLDAICDTIDIAKQMIIKELIDYPINQPIVNTMNQENNYTLITTRNQLGLIGYNYCGNGYIIEEMILNQFNNKMFE